jgi:hypothetical protein
MELKASSEQLRAVRGTRALLPSEDGAFVDFFCDRPHRHRRLQRQLTRKVEDAAGRQWSASNPPTEQREKLRRDFLKQPGAKDVFTAIPAEDSWSIPIRGAAWRTAVAMWLGLPHGMLTVEECQGKHAACQRSGKEWDHYQSCLRINGCSKKTRRHDGMVYNLAWCLRSGLNLDPKIEPKYLDVEGRKRPDIQVAVGNSEFLVDVAVLHTHGKGRQRWGTDALMDEEKAKRKHYQDMARGMHAEVIPFVVDASGVWGPSATKWVSQLLNKAVEEGFIHESDVRQERRRIRYAVAHALHKGNAAMWYDYNHRNPTAPRLQSPWFTEW